MTTINPRLVALAADLYQDVDGSVLAAFEVYGEELVDITEIRLELHTNQGRVAVLRPGDGIEFDTPAPEPTT